MGSLLGFTVGSADGDVVLGTVGALENVGLTVGEVGAWIGTMIDKYSEGVGKLQLRLLITKVPKNLFGSSQVPQPHVLAMQIAVNRKARAGLKPEFN